MSEGIVALASRCHRLQTFIASWCWDVSHSVRDLLRADSFVGVAQISQRDLLRQLTVLDFTGMKRLTDEFLRDIVLLLPNLKVGPFPPIFR